MNSQRSKLEVFIPVPARSISARKNTEGTYYADGKSSELG